MNKYLTQDEVNNLPDEAKVIIIWSGGNGPYKYVVGKYEGLSYTTFMGSDKKRYLGNCIDFVGDRKPFTMVVLDD